MISFNKTSADVFVPDGSPVDAALARTTILCIGAHQDDNECAGYAGIAECYRKADKWFGSVTVTDGAGSARGGPFADVTDAGMVAIRREEQRNAARIGQYGIQIQLDYSSKEVKATARDAVTQDLAAIIRAASPEIVYTHNPFDKHDTHVAVFLRTIEALRSLPTGQRPPRVIGYEGWRSLDWLMDDEKVVLNCDPYPSLSAALLGVFDSQISGGKRYDLGIQGRRMANASMFQSHSVDTFSAATWAVDLTPLIKDDSMSVASFVDGRLGALQKDVHARLDRFA